MQKYTDYTCVFLKSYLKLNTNCKVSRCPATHTLPSLNRVKCSVITTLFLTEIIAFSFFVVLIGIDVDMHGHIQLNVKLNLFFGPPNQQEPS